MHVCHDQLLIDNMESGELRLIIAATNLANNVNYERLHIPRCCCWRQRIGDADGCIRPSATELHCVLFMNVVVAPIEDGGVMPYVTQIFL